MKRLVALWHEGKISGLEFSQKANKLTEAKPSINKKLKKRFAKIDRKYNPHPKKIVSGGLPELRPEKLSFGWTKFRGAGQEENRSEHTRKTQFSKDVARHHRGQ